MPRMPQLPTESAELLEAWAKLPEQQRDAVRIAIVAPEQPIVMTSPGGDVRLIPSDRVPILVAQGWWRGRP